ncbi:MAG: 4-alpha-glucanotransferase [Myxococcales bacterium]|nr:4-alpha-glucanotransferase [Myxococcales bacterium]
MGPTDDKPLDALCRAMGVERTYRDALGRPRHACDEALIAVLRALGAPIERPTEAAEALQAIEQARSSELVEPVTVAWAPGAATLRTRLPPWQSGPFLLEGETDEGARWHVEGRVDDLPVEGEEPSGRLVVRSLTIAPGLPPGVHALRWSLGPRVETGWLFVAPARAYGASEPLRDLGLFAPLHALRDADRGDAWDLGALRALCRSAAMLGAQWVGTLPLYATFLDAPFAPSPYVPASRLFWNECFVDPTACLEWEASERARALWSAVESEEREARREPWLEWAAAWARRRPVLQALAETCFESEAGRTRLQHWMQQRPRALDYARFRAATERFGAGWHVWPSGAARDGRLDESDVDPAAVRRHLYAQWAAETQLDDVARRAKADGVRLYLDLPIGVHPDAYDTWRERDAFANGASLGAPPDPLFEGGQRWGIPVPRTDVQRRTGYRHLREVLETACRFAGALRIDHVLGWHRLFVVPDGWPATQGVYVRQPADELYALASIVSARTRCRLVGEDLGTVPAELRPTMARRGLSRLFVSGLELSAAGDDGRLADPEPGAFASLGTHDTPPWAAYVAGDDLREAVALGLRAPHEAEQAYAARRRALDAVRAHLRAQGRPNSDDPEDALALARALLEELAASDAGVVLVALDDLWGERRAHNVPGTDRERRNWQLRHARPVQALAAPEVRALFDTLRALRERVLARAREA